ncbi:cupin [Candidatus Woesebacteria bacterium RBG_13_36_22]|uniref:Cupin n=1 Tax=Candidatus Woesebacteria bacterium RBG_13_36_22 TaxID=1802478 RepID=A0A1F7X5P9_9BACT|nr:MAG: cupin [Candidatus Woesebacteria bacterium RBG_13_36_22]
MAGFYVKLEDETEKNSNFRKVIFTGKYSQLVLMSLKPGEEIGMEVHETVDQFFRIEEGEAKFIADGVETKVYEDEAYIVPAGTQHNVINSGSKDLKLYTIYSPANHPDGTINVTKKDAEEYAKSHH